MRNFTDLSPEDIVLPHPEQDASTYSVRQLDSNEEAGTTTFIASTEDEDRALDIVKQDWRLKNYRSNPVILDNHNPGRVVGRAEDVRVPRSGEDAGSLVIRVAWDLSSPDPSIVNVGMQHLKGIRRAGSVGFRSGRKTARNQLDKSSPYYREPETFKNPFGFEFQHAGVLHERNELLEFSSATIPMNPNALQKSMNVRAGVEEDLEFDICAAVLRRMDEDAAFAAQFRKRLLADDVFSDLLARCLPGVLRASENQDIRRILTGILEARAPRVRLVPSEGPFGALFPVTVNEEGS